MSVKKFASNMRKTIEYIKNNGSDSLYCDNIINYLSEVENSPEFEPSPNDLERYKYDLQSAHDTRKFQHDSQLEMFRSVISSGQGAVRTMLILNGGAAVALLAFIGHLLTCTSSENCADLTIQIKGLSSGLLYFAFGALGATIVSGCTYLTQWFYAGEKAWQLKVGFFLNIVCIFSGILSYIFFSFGLIQSYSTINLFQTS